MSSLSADFLTPFRKSARSVLILDPAQPESPPAFYANRNGPAHSIQPSPLSADSLWSSPKSQTLPAYRRIGVSLFYLSQFLGTVHAVPIRPFPDCRFSTFEFRVSTADFRLTGARLLDS